MIGIKQPMIHKNHIKLKPTIGNFFFINISIKIEKNN